MKLKNEDEVEQGRELELMNVDLNLLKEVELRRIN